MTEKRFRNNGSMIFDNEKPMNTIEVVDLLNKQHETIQQSKELIKTYYNENSDLIKENEQLKSFVEYEKREHKHWKRECLENIKEIAQLKREITQLKGDPVIIE